MHEHEVHGDDADALTSSEVALHLRRLTRATIALRDEMRASQSTPPRWLTSRWRDILYIIALLALAFGGDVKGLAGYIVGHTTGLPVVSPAVVPAPAAPETPS